MNAKHWSWIILLGVSIFIIGAILLALGLLESPWNYFLATAALSLIGVGASGKRRASR